MKAESIYVSAGCRRASGCSACLGDSGLVAFAAGPRICLWHPSVREASIQASLAGHACDITKICTWRKDAIVSGDELGNLRLWLCKDTIWKSLAFPRPSARTASVCALASIDIPSQSLAIIASSHSDGSILLWMLGARTQLPEDAAQAAQTATYAEHIDLAQTLDCHGRLPLDCSLALLPGSSDIILAVALTDSHLRLYTSSIFRLKFELAVHLPGHTDWIRSVSLIADPTDPSQMLMASGSQDNSGRLWRIRPGSNEVEPKNEMPIDVRLHSMAVDSRTYTVQCEALLVAHEGWITDLAWFVDPDRALQLLTSSADRSLIVWRFDQNGRLWAPIYQLGELKPSEHSLGFFGALHTWGENGDEYLLAHGWSGAFHVWRKLLQGAWTPATGPTGHTGSVRAIAWEPRGEYLLSAGADRTVRLHASSLGNWREVGRPQIHGYEIYAVAFVGQDRLQYASASDESVVRLYLAPKRFVHRLNGLQAVSGFTNATLGDRPQMAVLPSLGLTSRPIDENVAADGDNLLPLEEELSSLTVWPEKDKFYGHGYELRAVASSPDGRFLASACKAATPEHAALRIRDFVSEQEIVLSPEESHSLTISRVAFSEDGNKLLTCSRDRCWRIYTHKGHSSWSLLAVGHKAHNRLIHDGCWLDSAGTKFATASRDKTIKMWSLNDQSCTAYAVISLQGAATAIAAHVASSPTLVAVGTDFGDISILSDAGNLLHKLSAELTHTCAVTQLAFSPQRTQKGKIWLASCGNDSGVRINAISM